jgi:hypothetical protein
MKFFLFVTFLFCILTSSSDCHHKEKTTYKGRLEIKAMCSNYTISVIEGKMDSSLIVPEWTDENTGKSYHNVFKLADPCDFPSTINQGDEFYFTLDTVKTKDCMVCMAYYPVPPKALDIKVLPQQ